MRNSPRRPPVPTLIRTVRTLLVTSFATGVEMKIVSQLLRRSCITITADTYTFVLPQLACGAAGKTAALVPRGTSPHSRAPLGPIPDHCGQSQPTRRIFRSDERPGQHWCGPGPLDPSFVILTE
jgi:hypothetical protein